MSFSRQDLMGPYAEDELIADPPTSAYLTGILYPGGAHPAEEANDTLGLGMGDDGDDGVNSAADLRRIPLPGAIGLTFLVRGDITHLDVSWEGGRYTSTSDDGQRAWQRTPVHGSLSLPLTPGTSKHTVAIDVTVDAIARRAGDITTVSLFLTNRSEEPKSGRNDSLCLFQPRLEINAGGAAAFLDRSHEADIQSLSDEERSTRLIYSGMPEFARGHNCAAEWDAEDGQSATALRTEIMPFWEVHPILPKDSGLECLSMGFLANASAAEAISSIEPLLKLYEDWIEEQQTEKLPNVIPALKETAEGHVLQCTTALKRMRDGLLCLQDPEVGEAFRFACRVMLLQRAHSGWSLARRRGEDNELKLEGSWRPFQLAFLLMNIPATVDPAHPDRDVVDLLWFPTGGGKTEAYLGVAAFTMALRRLRDEIAEGAGITVIMRYTLRLLTLQQFQRATALICACEVVRRSDPGRWGSEPFRIGLWVGTRATPKNVRGAEFALRECRRGRTPASANPVQFSHCPWCGTPIELKDYHINKRAGRMLITCPNRACDFHGSASDADSGLPVVVTDEEIYSTRPALLIGTVDKFAQLPWVEDTRQLFGRGVRPTAPPSLILMDELHLISGPLGTITGLYETVLDVLATTDDGVRPRYVASTATIRHADEQCRGLFTRRVSQFPPPGLDARDSWFARERSDMPGRLYFGVNPVGKSGKTALLRVYAALLHKAWLLLEQGEDVDPWWTLVGYFNSIRELAGAIPLCEDDVNDRLRGLRTDDRSSGRAIYRDRIQELTSRLTSTEVPQALTALEQTLDGEIPPKDVVLASNMISVGVDIDRLGMMVVAGQPKTTSEYIQATSRVGRRHPGLVCSLYRWTRPRDISHYEQFRSYHQSLYQFVEATSVTPFAPQALNRGLHALIVALARHLDGGLPAGKDAKQIKKLPAGIADRIIKILQSRAAMTGESGSDVTFMAEGLLDQWRQRAGSHPDLQYGTMAPPGGEPKPVLMEPAPGSGDGWPTLTSLREVEPSAEFYFHSPKGMEPDL
ncbi:MAG: helicase-related protein [Bradymonadia bacterium]